MQGLERKNQAEEKREGLIHRDKFFGVLCRKRNWRDALRDFLHPERAFNEDRAAGRFLRGLVEEVHRDLFFLS